MTTAGICAVPWAADTPGIITNEFQDLWRTTLRRYGVGWDDRFEYLPALVVPEALGGRISLPNLAPLPKQGVWTLARKQLVERRVYSELCLGHLTLPEAQNKAGVQWETAWRIYVAP